MSEPVEMPRATDEYEWVLRIVAALATALVALFLVLVIYARTQSYAYLDWDDNTIVEQNRYIVTPPYLQHAADFYCALRRITGVAVDKFFDAGA